MHSRFHCLVCVWLTLTLTLTSAAAAAAAGEQRDPLAEDDGLPDALDDERQETRNAAPRSYAAAGYNALAPGGFRPAAPLAELAGYSRPAAPAPRPRPAKQQHQQQEQEQEEEEEREEPDRLAQLLQQSRFDCGAKPGGYYADAELACEVFHYCADGVKHSWICPDGFTFHQVHLICMPPTQDNICQQSAQYHFVNDYLYRAVNEEEKARRPDLPLKYADRYYPQEVYRDDRRDYDDDEEDRPRPRPAPAPLTAPRPILRPQPHVFRSAEAVNIPLGQRRPQPQPQPHSFDNDF